MNPITIEYENLAKVNENLLSLYNKSFTEFVRKGWYILGAEVDNFEKKFAKYCQVSHCVGVASGLDALIIALKSCNFSKDTEIIVPSNTYIATILAIIQCNLKPVLVEPKIDTYNIDPQKIEEKITARTKAIMPVHLYGKACDMGPIQMIAKEYKLEIIEDCAQAHGARYMGKKVGSFGLGCFSFYPTKNLGALGDAGAITCSEEETTQNLRSLRNYGFEKKYVCERIGLNSRLDEIQAGFLNLKLDILDKINEHKRKLANVYFEQIKGSYVLPKKEEGFYDIYHIFNIRCQQRKKLKDFLEKNGVMTEVHYPIPPHQQKAYASILEGNYPISEEIHSTTLSLPISFFHTEDDICKVSDLLNDFSEKFL